jgi:hypothetical protein
METEELQNWNQLINCKYTFWQEEIDIDSKEISVRVNLEIDCNDWEYPNINIDTKIFIIDYDGVLRKSTELKNLFKLENLKSCYFYLLPLENEMIEIALNFAKTKIKEIQKSQGENL